MDWSVTQRQRLHSLFGVFFGPEITGVILSLVRPALRLTGGDPSPPFPASAAASTLSPSRSAAAMATGRPGGTATAGAGTPTTAGAGTPTTAGAGTHTTAAARAIMPAATPLEDSRLGGAASLPAGQAWPRWDTRPLTFLALIDFAELAAVHPTQGLPETGNAAFFYVSETPRPWGDRPGQEDGWRVFPGAVAPAEPPGGVAVHPPLRLSAAPFLSLPGPGEPALGALTADYSGVSDVYAQLYAAWQEHVWATEPLHQLGGWPAPVEGPVIADDGTVLLAQFDTDDRLGWHWGDPGRVYFTLNAAQRLDQAKLILQAR